MDKSILNQLLEEKKNAGFEKKSWDEWFEFLFYQNSPKSQLDIMEKTVKNYFYEYDFDQWVKNFAINLEHVWKEKSARDLDPSENPDYKMENHSAIVIGKGPSIKKHKHLEILTNSNYNGSIICCDGALVNVLKAGVNPERFPKFYVVTVDAYETQKNYYDNEIVDKFGSKIKGIFSTLTHPTVLERARQAKIQIHWLHPLFDYNEGRKSFNKIASLMVRAKTNKGLPAIQTGGNVGTSSWFVGWQILKCATIALIGINHGWNEDDSWETILTHRKKNFSEKIDVNDPTFRKLFPKIYNPDFKTYCILDPIFQFFSLAFKEFIARAPSNITTINATEDGSIFGERIKCMPFRTFLENYHL